MRFEPAIDRSRLLEAVRNAYALAVDSLTFEPVGLGSACYLLATHDGGRAFLRVWTHLRLDQPEAARQYTTLVVTRALHDRDLGVRLPYPLETLNGQLWADLSGMPFALAPFLEGSSPSQPLTAGVAGELGHALASLHRTTPVFAGLSLPRESLDISFEPLLQRTMAAARLGPDSRPALVSLKKRLTNWSDDIERQRRRLRIFQTAARGLDGPLVLCHTDLHVNNLLVDERGQLAIMDWDDVKLAPPEHDLWSGLGAEDVGETFAAFLDCYRRAGGAAPLSLEHFAFYLLRRYLEDFTLFLADLLDADADEREDAVLLNTLERECVGRWSRLDATLDVIAAALARAG